MPSRLAKGRLEFQEGMRIMEVPIPDRLKGIRLIHRGHRTCSPSMGLVPINMAPRPCSLGRILAH
ncbi:MAG: hypothetical protein CMJ40_10875 [Phycisphaerae bacterium]|nr:hypothetical protein [Phycisphaerae bacterium]